MSVAAEVCPRDAYVSACKEMSKKANSLLKRALPGESPPPSVSDTPLRGSSAGTRKHKPTVVSHPVSISARGPPTPPVKADAATADSAAEGSAAADGVSNISSSTVLETSWDRIRELNLSRNCLGKNGVIPLLTVIKKCPNLVRLDLADNYLNNDCALELCSLIEAYLPRLVTLNLSRNPVSYPVGKKLVKVLERNPYLCDVNVEGTLMNPGLAKIVMNKSKENAKKFLALNPLPSKTSTVEQSVFQTILLSNSKPQVNEAGIEGTTTSPALNNVPGLAALGEVHKEVRHQDAVRAQAAMTPEDDWYAIETIWNLAAPSRGGDDGQHRKEDGWVGLASVMALVRQDYDLAQLY